MKSDGMLGLGFLKLPQYHGENIVEFGNGIFVAFDPTVDAAVPIGATTTLAKALRMVERKAKSVKRHAGLPKEDSPLKRATGGLHAVISLADHQIEALSKMNGQRMRIDTVVSCFKVYKALAAKALKLKI